ncbi:DUF6415 family natural product biosynthesis protein [Streptomyces sp. NPDC014846]|uniref:DUF6415 family natural product biosynthesis protein n=1 Tax=Streptomyces sp. NPDC014846 TaxID=3364922 RepID=UPI0036F54761
MTAVGAPAPKLDNDLIRRAFKTVLGESRVGPPDLGSEEQRAHLAGLLRGQLQLLLRGLQDRVAGMSPETRKTADHVAHRADEALDVPLDAARTWDHLYDLAGLCRALLTLHELARPASRPQAPAPHCIS